MRIGENRWSGGCSRGRAGLGTGSSVSWRCRPGHPPRLAERSARFRRHISAPRVSTDKEALFQRAAKPPLLDFGARSSSDQMGAGRNLKPELITGAGWRLLAGRPVGKPHPAPAGRRHVTRRHVDVRRRRWAHTLGWHVARRHVDVRRGRRRWEHTIGFGVDDAAGYEQQRREGESVLQALRRSRGGHVLM